MRLIFVWLICLCIFSQNIHADGTLKVGMELTYPPFETIDTQGKPSGISVDIADALGQYLNKKVVIENIPFIGLIPSLTSKKIDIILSSMTVTEERKKSISFSDPYIKVGLCLLISKKSDLQSIDDANKKGRVIVVKLATTSQSWAETHLKEATLHILDKESACILEVVQGKADAFIYDQFAVYNAWQKYKEETRANFNAFVVGSWAIGTRKEDVDLLNEINAFINKFKEEGGFERLGDKYLQKQKEAFNKMGVPFYF